MHSSRLLTAGGRAQLTRITRAPLVWWELQVRISSRWWGGSQNHCQYPMLISIKLLRNIIKKRRVLCLISWGEPHKDLPQEGMLGWESQGSFCVAKSQGNTDIHTCSAQFSLLFSSWWMLPLPLAAVNPALRCLFFCPYMTWVDGCPGMVIWYGVKPSPLGTMPSMLA